MRWSHLLFSQGFGTRRECEQLILADRVRYAGRLIDEPQAEVEPLEGLEFEVEGRTWPFHERAVILLHKPAGYECSQRPGASPSVLSLLPGPLRRRGKGGVQSVGRLDVDTTGLLLLTDDGALLHRLTSPKHHVPKVYEATVKHAIDEEQIARLVAGVVLDDHPQPVRAAAAERLGENALRLTLTQGKYHQVKRMIAAVGNRCEALHRRAVGALELPGQLPPGGWQWLSARQRAELETRRD